MSILTEAPDPPIHPTELVIMRLREAELKAEERLKTLYDEIENIIVNQTSGRIFKHYLTDLGREVIDEFLRINQLHIDRFEELGFESRCPTWWAQHGRDDESSRGRCPRVDPTPLPELRCHERCSHHYQGCGGCDSGWNHLWPQHERQQLADAYELYGYENDDGTLNLRTPGHYGWQLNKLLKTSHYGGYNPKYVEKREMSPVIGWDDLRISESEGESEIVYDEVLRQKLQQLVQEFWHLSSLLPRSQQPEACPHCNSIQTWLTDYEAVWQEYAGAWPHDGSVSYICLNCLNYFGESIKATGWEGVDTAGQTMGVDYDDYYAETFDAEPLREGSPKELEILQYLANFNYEITAQTWDAPEKLTQPGIAQAVGLAQPNVGKYLTGLVSRGLVQSYLKHILERPYVQKSQVYVVTPKGYAYIRKVSV